MTREEKSTSPDGRYVVCVDSFEARAFQWVDTPELLDTATGRALLALTDCNWHLDSADWHSESVVVMRLRHFPDGLPGYEVTVDCERLIARVDDNDACPLERLDEALERAASTPRDTDSASDGSPS